MNDVQQPGDPNTEPAVVSQAQHTEQSVAQTPQTVTTAPPPPDSNAAIAPAGAGLPQQEIATPAVKSPEERKAALAQSVAREVANGGRVESQSDYQAIIVNGKKVNHLLHFFIGLFTLGVWWLFVWLPLTIFGGEKRSIVQIDDYGNVLVQKT